MAHEQQDMPQIVAQMEENLQSLFQWFCHHRMKVNENKTQMIVLGTVPMLRDVSAVTLTLKGSLVHESKTVKNLGVTLDQHLSYQSHIDAVIGRCTGMLKGVCLLHLLSENIFPVLRSN